MMIFEDTDNLNTADKNDLALSLFWLLILSPIQISSNWNFVFFFPNCYHITDYIFCLRRIS